MGKTGLFRQNVGSPLLSPKRVRMCAANWRSPSRLGESQRQIALDLREHRAAFNSPCLSKWFGFLERVPPKDPVVGQEAKHRNTQQRARNMVWAGACMVATETRSRGLMTIPTISQSDPLQVILKYQSQNGFRVHWGKIDSHTSIRGCGPGMNQTTLRELSCWLTTCGALVRALDFRPNLLAGNQRLPLEPASKEFLAGFQKPFWCTWGRGGCN